MATMRILKDDSLVFSPQQNVQIRVEWLQAYSPVQTFRPTLSKSTAKLQHTQGEQKTFSHFTPNTNHTQNHRHHAEKDCQKDKLPRQFAFWFDRVKIISIWFLLVHKILYDLLRHNKTKKLTIKFWNSKVYTHTINEKYYFFLITTWQVPPLC